MESIRKNLLENKTLAFRIIQQGSTNATTIRYVSVSRLLAFSLFSYVCNYLVLSFYLETASHLTLTRLLL